jgi:hypothetical protein
MDNNNNYANDIDDNIAYTAEEQKRIVLAEARANVARLSKPAARIVTKAAAMTIKPEPGEDYGHWMQRCKPSAMAGDPNLTEDRAADQCSVIYEESQVPGQPGGLHSYHGKPKGSAAYQRELDRQVQEKLAALADKVAQQNEHKPVKKQEPELLTPEQMQQVLACFDQRLVATAATVEYVEQARDLDLNSMREYVREALEETLADAIEMFRRENAALRKELLGEQKLLTVLNSLDAQCKEIKAALDHSNNTNPDKSEPLNIPRFLPSKPPNLN